MTSSTGMYPPPNISSLRRGAVSPQPQGSLVSLLPTQGIEWVKACVQTYPELNYLADAQVRQTEEGTANQNDPYSMQLFGQTYIEFDRTVMTLHCLKLILSGTKEAHETLTRDQPVKDQLSWEEFEKLHQQGTQINASRAMEAALVLGDIGKSEKAREQFTKAGATPLPDHDDFYGEVIRILQSHPDLSPTFSSLSAEEKKILTDSANLAHFGHITHLEGGPAMFSSLKRAMQRISSNALDFALFVHTCDVAGALGHVNKSSSLVYTASTHRAMQAMQEACRILSDSSKTEKDAYDTYLETRAKWLGLKPSEQSDRVLTRVGAMLRLFTEEDGRILKGPFLRLDSDIQQEIIDQFDIQTKTEFGRTPTYMPAVLVNLNNNTSLGKFPQERLTQAVQVGLPFLARVLAEHRRLIKSGEADPNVPLNFNNRALLKPKF